MAMRGSEWCSDTFVEIDIPSLATKPQINYMNLVGSKLRVSKGGSYLSRKMPSISYREDIHPEDRSYSRGFRIARKGYAKVMIDLTESL